MKVRCSHGFFFFEEESVGEISRFCSNFGFEIVSKDFYYTFAGLLLALDYSFENQSYLGVTALYTFEGTPWEVMRRNRLIFDFTTGTVKSIDTITTPLRLSAAANYFYADGLIMPGSLDPRGRRVTDFTGEFQDDGMKFRYTEVQYDQNI